MSLLQEGILQATSVFRELIFQFASGHFTVPMMVGAALGGGYVLGMARSSLSKAFVGALGGISVVAFLWLAANLLIFLANKIPGLV